MEYSKQRHFNILEFSFFNNPYDGWIVGGGGVILRTIDGGISWNIQNAYTTKYLTSVFFLNEDIGFVVGQYGILLNTNNGGDLWNKQFISAESLSSVFFVIIRQVG